MNFKCAEDLSLIEYYVTGFTAVANAGVWQAEQADGGTMSCALDLNNVSYLKMSVSFHFTKEHRHTAITQIQQRTSIPTSSKRLLR